MKSTPPVIAYSYIRFSTREQRGNTSIARQTTLRDAYVAREGLLLDDKLRLIDDGVSAHRGKHRSDKHALGQFLALVKAGRIKPGSHLIVESLDRLSREEVDEALELVLSLTRAGVRVVQLQPAEVVYAKPVEPMKLMMGIMELSRGYSESKMKSERIGAAWESKREKARATGAAVSKWCPAWLKRVGDRYELISERADAVQLIYQLSADGFGIAPIIKRLIAGGHKPFNLGRRKGERWSNSYLGRILSTRAVVGEYQPLKGGKPDGPPIPNYYPAVIDEALYYRVRAGLKHRTRQSVSSGRSTNGVNLFQGMMRHAPDGDTIEWRTFRDNRNGKTWKAHRYVNAKALVAQAKLASFPVESFEAGVLDRLREIDPREVLPAPDGVGDRVLTLSARREEIAGQLRAIEDRIVRGEALDVLVNAAKRLTAELRRVTDELVEAEMSAASPQAEAWGTAKTLIETLAEQDDQEAARLRLRQAIRRIVTGVWCLFLGNGSTRLAAVQVFFASGATRSYLIRHRPGAWNSKDRPEVPWEVR
ncbi:MAG TPA: recombinase family protein, partial [Fimbriiglobus sp.]|nr:recombinase family protein [Fimbriiglobus sp.]